MATEEQVETMIEEKSMEGLQETKTEDKQLALLKETLDKKNQESQERYDRLLRLQAEFENYKKRLVKEQEEFRHYTAERIINNFLPVIDNLERALDSSKKQEDYQAIVKGIELVLNQFLDILKKEGVTDIAAIGEKFDPTRHEVIMQIESNKHDDNEIIQELQKGYMLNDRVIRASRVTVAKKKVE